MSVVGDMYARDGESHPALGCFFIELSAPLLPDPRKGKAQRPPNGYNHRLISAEEDR